MQFLLTILLCVFFIHTGQALKCYICTTTETEIDQSCVDSPETLETLDCNKKYCTTQRQEYLDPKGKVASISRGCDDKPNYMNQIIEDSTFRTYYVACQTDLCNGGSGKSSNDNSGALGDKSTIICEGTDSGTDTLTISTTFILSAIIFMLIYNN